MTYTQTDPPGGITGPGAESDIYHCLVLERDLRLLTVFKLLIRRPPPQIQGPAFRKAIFIPHHRNCKWFVMRVTATDGVT